LKTVSTLSEFIQKSNRFLAENITKLSVFGLKLSEGIEEIGG
jgi:hypothetical protein